MFRRGGPQLMAAKRCGRSVRGACAGQETHLYNFTTNSPLRSAVTTAFLCQSFSVAHFLPPPKCATSRVGRRALLLHTHIRTQSAGGYCDGCLKTLHDGPLALKHTRTRYFLLGIVNEENHCKQFRMQFSPCQQLNVCVG